MAEVLVIGKKISEMGLVNEITGEEKIPTGALGDKAVTTGQLLTYVNNNGVAQWGRIGGDIANQDDLQNQFAQQLATLQNHIQDQGNPHNVIKEQVGLALVDNTADMDKPVSTAVKEALSLKADQTYVEDSLANKTHNSLLGRDADGAHPAEAILDGSGVTQQQVNDLTGAPYRVKAGGYNIGERVVLENGDIVKSTVANNTANPNIDMTGWVRVGKTIVSSIAKLLEIQDLKAGSIVNVLSYYEPVLAEAFPYKGGGTFVYDSAKALINDGVACFNGWIRVIEGIVTPEMAGAKGDGVTTDTVPFQIAANYASANQLTLHLENTYALRVTQSHTASTGETSAITCVLIDRPLNITANSASILVEGNKHGLWVASSNVSISGVSFDKIAGTTRGTIGHTVRVSSIGGRINNIHISDCRFNNHSDNSIVFASVASSIIESCFFNDIEFNPSNSGDAYVELTNCTGCIVTNNILTATPSHGIRVNGSINCIVSNNYGENIGANILWRTFIYLDGGSSGVGLLESRGNKVFGNIGINVQNGVRCGLGWNYDNSIIGNYFKCKRHGLLLEASRGGIFVFPVAGEPAIKVFFDKFIDGLTIRDNTIISDDYGISIADINREVDSPDITANKLVITGNYIRSKKHAFYSTITTRASVTNSNIQGNTWDVPVGVGSIFFSVINNSVIKNNITTGSPKRNVVDITTGRETCDLGSVIETEAIAVTTASSGGFSCRDAFNLRLGAPCYITKVDEADTLPTGYNTGTVYYLAAYPNDASKYRLSSTMQAAITGSSVVSITNVGTGRFRLVFI